MDKRMIKTVFGMAAGFYWCASMSNSGAYFEPYLLIGLAGFLSSQYFLLKSPFADRKENRIPAGILSAFLSAAVLLANYPLFPLAAAGCIFYSANCVLWLWLFTAVIICFIRFFR